MTMKSGYLTLLFLFPVFVLFSNIAPTPPDKWLADNFTYSDTTFETGQTKRIEVVYDYNNGSILPESKIVLDSVVEFLQKNPKLVLEVSSHTDSRGNDKYNYQLSVRRATAVKSYIDQKLGNFERMTSRGAGEREFIYSEEYISQNALSPEEKEKLHAKNRRTVLTIRSVTYKKD